MTTNPSFVQSKEYKVTTTDAVLLGDWAYIEDTGDAFIFDLIAVGGGIKIIVDHTAIDRLRFSN